MILCKNCSPRKECFYYQNGETRTECKFYKQMTEQEYIQSCNTEQLAEFLTKVILDDKRFRMTMVGGVNETKLWLKQPHREEKHE